MAQVTLANIDKLSPAQGYRMPANNPNAAAPDNITHAQLRITPFNGSTANTYWQGTVVSGENSSFEFSVPDAYVANLFKLYVSTDGTNYYEKKTYGGSSGINPFGTTDISGLVTLATAQSITATKTFNTNANLVIASGSDITVQTGGDLTLADAPTASTDATNKAYVDGLTYKSCIFWIDAFYLDKLTALSYRRIYNNTGVTPTLAYVNNSLGESGLQVTFNRTSAAWDINSNYLSADDGFASYPAGFFYIDSSINQASSATSAIITFADSYLQAGQTTTQHYYDMLTADTWGRTGHDPSKYLVTNVSGITLSSAVTISQRRYNGRIELRFYD